MYSIQHYVIKFVSDLWQGGGFLLVLLFPSPIKLTVMIELNTCIVESGIKHHNPNPYSLLCNLRALWKISVANCVYPHDHKIKYICIIIILSSVKIGQHLESVTFLECAFTRVQMSMTLFSLKLRPEIDIWNTFTLIKTVMRFKQIRSDTVSIYFGAKMVPFYYYHFDLIIKVKYFQKNSP